MVDSEASAFTGAYARRLGRQPNQKVAEQFTNTTYDKPLYIVLYSNNEPAFRVYVPSSAASKTDRRATLRAVSREDYSDWGKANTYIHTLNVGSKTHP